MDHPQLIPLVPPRPMLRRDLLKQLATGLLTLVPGLSRSTTSGTTADASGSSDEARLLAHARALAARPYRPCSTQLPKPLITLGWDGCQSIGYRPDHALWAGQHLSFRAKFFHLELLFKSAVQIHKVVSGYVRLIACDPATFDYG